jgi:signal peptidase I
LPDPWTLLPDEEAEQSEPEHVAPSARSDADEDADAWAAIADASGYDAEEEFEPPTFGKIARPQRNDERGSWLADHFPDQEPAPDPVEEAFAEHDAEDMERDLVLRAFEAHAASDVDEEEEEPLEPGAFQELFGNEAQGIVDDLIEPKETPSFAKMRMAPQRTSLPGSAPFSDEDDWTEGDEEDEDGMAAAYLGNLDDAPFLAGSIKTHDPIDAKKTRTWVRELVETGLLALLVFLSVRASFQNFKVDGSSMSPTLADGQFLIVNKLVYSEVDVDKMSKYVPFIDAGDDPTRHVFHGPERGDIVVLRDPGNPDQDLIKRVIALPGEQVEVFEGAVYINDQLLEEPYIKDQWGRNGQGNYAAVIVPEGTYFVMGDNRDNSKDSRSPQIGFIEEDLIIGRAELSYLPLDAFGLIGNGGASLSEQDGRPRLTSELHPDSTVAVLTP